MVVTAKVFTCAKGEFLDWADKSDITPSGRGSFWMMLLTAGDEASVLVTKTSVAQVLASGAVECANTGYTRRGPIEFKLWDRPGTEPLPSNTIGWTRQAWPYGSFNAYRPFTVEKYPGYSTVEFSHAAGGPPVVSFLLYWEPPGSTSDATRKPFVIYRFPAPFTLSTSTTIYFPKNLGWVATA